MDEFCANFWVILTNLYRIVHILLHFMWYNQTELSVRRPFRKEQNRSLETKTKGA